jgi:hypothetical protein
MSITNFEASPSLAGLEDLVIALYSNIPLEKSITIKIRGNKEDVDKFLIETKGIIPNGLGYEDILWEVTSEEGHLITNEDYSDQLDTILMECINF